MDTEKLSNVSVDELKSLLNERKADLLKKIYQKNIAYKTIEKKLQDKLDEQNSSNDRLTEIEEIFTNADTVRADIEELSQELELKLKEQVNESGKLADLTKRRDKLALLCKEPSPHDQKILDTCSTRIKLYEKVTGVHWIEKSAERAGFIGYVGNKKNNYLKVISPSADNLWEEVGKSASADWSKFLPQNQENH